jgi:glycosyltransferase involved in cell wall biosynthesis
VERLVSVVIPNYNGSGTIGKCLEAAFRSDYKHYEVIVVDDASTDGSREIIRRFPCRLIELEKHSGASRARNAGALQSRGDVLFFTDADCLLLPNTLSLVNSALETNQDHEIVIGGTYTALPHDTDFFSTFQSLFVHYSETKKREPDYIAAHAMVISSHLFRKSEGFPENFLPMIEDVEFSHRLRHSGIRLVMNSAIQVEHIFNFTFIKSLRNGFRKSCYWTMYSLSNRDLFRDSGTASWELKSAVFFWLCIFSLAFFAVALGNASLLSAVPLILILNWYISRGFLRICSGAKGRAYSLVAALYYALIYPGAVASGALVGIVRYLSRSSLGILR